MYPSVSTMVADLRVYYGLEAAARKIYALICHFERRGKASQRLSDRRKRLYDYASTHVNETMRDAMLHGGSFLNLIPKSDAFEGKYLPVPIIFGKDDG